MKVCDNCFYHRPNNEASVWCQRYPPAVTKAEGPQITVYFPLIGKAAWCGEWKPEADDMGMSVTDLAIPRRQ